MSSIRGTKTVVATAAAIFAGSAALTGRTWMRVRNMDDCVSGIVGGQTLEPGEAVEFTFSSTATETVMAQSNGRAIEMEVIEA